MTTFVDLAACGSHSRSAGDQRGGTKRVLREVLGMTQPGHHRWALVGGFLKLETARTQVSSSYFEGTSVVIYLCSVVRR